MSGDSSQCNLFSDDLTREELEVLSRVVMMRQLAQDEVLIQEGSIDHSLHCVLSGALCVEKSTGAGETICLHVLRKGDLAGEMGFVDGAPHSATLRALAPTHVMTLERERLESLLESHPALVYHVMRTIIRTAHKILKRMNFHYMELSNYITKQHGRY
ncbi:Cyclic nucleotide-binding domain-containing protein [Gammaproteobacteria bacterium]